MPFLRLSLLLIFIMVLTACNQQEQDGKSSNNEIQGGSTANQNSDSSAASGGIVAGKLETTLQVDGRRAIFKIKNQTEQVKELVLAGKTSYEYLITNKNGKTVYQKSKSKPQYEQKHPITLKQAEAVEFELEIPDKLKEGKYSLTAVLHTKPVLKAKTTFTISK